MDVVIFELGVFLEVIFFFLMMIGEVEKIEFVCIFSFMSEGEFILFNVYMNDFGARLWSIK